jgi:hypothetical protein
VAAARTHQAKLAFGTQHICLLLRVPPAGRDLSAVPERERLAAASFPLPRAPGNGDSGSRVTSSPPRSSARADATSVNCVAVGAACRLHRSSCGPSESAFAFSAAPRLDTAEGSDRTSEPPPIRAAWQWATTILTPTAPYPGLAALLHGNVFGESGATAASRGQVGREIYRRLRGLSICTRSVVCMGRWLPQLVQVRSACRVRFSEASSGVRTCRILGEEETAYLARHMRCSALRAVLRSRPKARLTAGVTPVCLAYDCVCVRLSTCCFCCSSPAARRMSLRKVARRMPPKRLCLRRLCGTGEEPPLYVPATQCLPDREAPGASRSP